MSYRGTAPSDSEASGPFGFLKTVVSDGPGLERNDSDKENDQGLMTVPEESSETQGGVENSKGQVQGHLNQGLHGFENTDSTVMAKDKEKDMWDEFYNEDDFIAKKDEPVPFNDFTTTFEIENNRVLDKVEEEQEGMDERSQGDDYSSTFDSSVKDDDGDRNISNEADSSSNNKRKPRKKKRLFKRRLPPPIVATCEATGGSHPDLGQCENNFQTNQLETMSESGGAGPRGRRLSRRKQAARPRCAGPTPSGDVLQQKYQELEQLVLKPLANPAVYVKQTRQQMLRLQGLSSQYHMSNHSGGNHVEGLPPPSGNHREERSRENHVIVEETSDQGYSTIRSIQVVQNGTSSSTSTRHNRPQTAHPRRPRSGQREVRPASAGRGRPTSANCQTRENTGNVSGTLQSFRGAGARGRGAKKNRGGRSQSGSSRSNRRSDSGSKDRSSRDSRESRDASSDNPSRSNSRSPSRVVPCTDTHLKYSDNPTLRQWLKTKNKQHRQQKLEERKKKREERAEKQEIERKRQEVFQDSDKKVKEWMAKKRKEAFKKAKEEKKKAQEEEMEMIEWKEHGQYTGSLRGHSIRRPQSAPAHSDRKMFIPVIRPDGDHTTNSNAKDLSNSETPTPHPPKSKFVYKRPVSGRVRLMKLQQERKEDSKKQEMQKKELEKLTEEEKNRKMRISYDQWLLKKRQEDYEKRQKAARERALAKSDPELERIVPEMARRRIENIQRGKKRIQTNMDSIDAQVNKSFGGGDFGEEENAQNGSLSDAPGLQVSGQKKSLGQRPSSAKPSNSNSPLNPQMSKSPRRPKSAHPRVQSLMDDNEDQRVVDAKAFQLPFPPELGVPKYVAERQEKLFSAKVIEKASTDTLPLSTDTNIKDTDSQPPPANSKNDFQDRETENDFHREDSEVARLETQDFSKKESDEIFKDTKAEKDDADSSFFVTDGNVEIIEEVAEEFVLCETIPAEAFDDEDESDHVQDMTHDQQEIPESNGDKDTREEEGVAETNVEYKYDEEEAEKMSDVEEEAPTVPDIEIKKLPEESVLEELDETLDRELEKSEELISAEEQIMEQQVISQLIVKESMEEESVAKVTEDTRQEEQMEEKEVQGDEEEPKSEASEGKSSTKHVSFVEEAEIHEDPLAGIPPEDYDTFSEDEEAEDERGDFYGDESPRNENEFWEGDYTEEKPDSYDDDYF